jgi:hypothetical protein
MTVVARGAAPTPVVSVLPATLNLALYAGDSVTVSFTFTDASGNPLDMSGTWSAQVRSAPGAADPPLAVFGVDTTQAASGVIVISLDDEATAALPIATTLAWDLEQQTGTDTVRTTHRGSVTVTEDVTRP